MMNPRLSVFLCFLATLCEGIDLQTAGVAAAGIHQQFHPDSQMLSYFFSAGTFGLFIGAIPASYPLENFTHIVACK
jgi:AAHS family 3-hydroxyphenylpropionic acid transporter